MKGYNVGHAMELSYKYKEKDWSLLNKKNKIMMILDNQPRIKHTDLVNKCISQKVGAKKTVEGLLKELEKEKKIFVTEFKKEKYYNLKPDGRSEESLKKEFSAVMTQIKNILEKIERDYTSYNYLTMHYVINDLDTLRERIKHKPATYKVWNSQDSDLKGAKSTYLQIKAMVKKSGNLEELKHARRLYFEFEKADNEEEKIHDQLRYRKFGLQKRSVLTEQLQKKYNEKIALGKELLDVLRSLNPEKEL